MSETRIWDKDREEYRPLNRTEKMIIALVRSTDPESRSDPDDVILMWRAKSSSPLAEAFIEAIDEGIKIYLGDESDEQRRLLEEKIRRQRREIKELERQLGRREPADE